MPTRKRTGGGGRGSGRLLPLLPARVDRDLRVYTFVTQEKPLSLNKKEPLPIFLTSIAPVSPKDQSPPENRSPSGALSPGHRPPPQSRARVAIVVDDLGEKALSPRASSMEFSDHLSVLPFEPHSRDLALEAQQNGKESSFISPWSPWLPKTDPGEVLF